MPLPAGLGDERCKAMSFPTCQLSLQPQPTPELFMPCASLLRASPVACECVAQCLAAGHEVCGPLNYGCQRPWRDHGRQRRLDAEPDIPCLATLRQLPAQRLCALGAAAACFRPVDQYRRLPRAGARSSRAPCPSLSRRKTTAALPAAAVAVVACSSRPAARKDGVDGRRARRGPGEMQCICVDGAYDTGCEHLCQNDCFNDCSGHGALSTRGRGGKAVGSGKKPRPHLQLCARA